MSSTRTLCLFLTCALIAAGRYSVAADGSCQCPAAFDGSCPYECIQSTQCCTVGPQGPPGFPGPQGPAGNQGVQGPTGSSAPISFFGAIYPDRINGVPAVQQLVNGVGVTTVLPMTFYPNSVFAENWSLQGNTNFTTSVSGIYMLTYTFNVFVGGANLGTNLSFGFRLYDRTTGYQFVTTTGNPLGWRVDQPNGTVTSFITPYTWTCMANITAGNTYQLLGAGTGTAAGNLVVPSMGYLTFHLMKAL